MVREAQRPVSSRGPGAVSKLLGPAKKKKKATKKKK